MSPHVIHLGKIPIRLGLAGLTLPALAVLAVAQLPAQVQLPLLGIRSLGQVTMLVASVILATYVHELGHVVAAKAMGLEVAFVALDGPVPAVEPVDVVLASAGPRERFWFALGGPAGDLLCGTTVACLAVVSRGSFRWWCIGYAFGAALQLLNALPSTVSGSLLLAGGVTLMATGSPAVGLSLAAAGAAVVAVRLIARTGHADGDHVLRAWRDMRAQTPRSVH